MARMLAIGFGHVFLYIPATNRGAAAPLLLIFDNLIYQSGLLPSASSAGSQ